MYKYNKKEYMMNKKKPSMCTNKREYMKKKKLVMGVLYLLHTYRRREKLAGMCAKQEHVDSCPDKSLSWPLVVITECPSFLSSPLLS